ncbi:MAG: DUF4097 domain-containing protein [Firmicutes bacterium]|nr:DUF4097 domain-containing protein [Bacillota bacterium]
METENNQTTVKPLKNKKLLYTAIVGVILFCIGAALFVGGMSASGWDAKNLSVLPPYAEKSEEFENLNQAFTLSDRNMRVHIGVSPDDKIRITYFEREKEFYTVTQSDTEIGFTKEWKYNMFERMFFFDTQSPAFTLLLPADYSGSVSVKTTNGTVKAEGITCARLSVESTNASIESIRVTATGELSVYTTNGAAAITDTVSAGNLSVRSSNGNITLSNVSAADIALRTTNGRFTLSDVAAQGKIEAETTNGNITAERVSAEGMLRLKTTNGNINFVRISTQAAVRLESTNGSVQGSILGAQSDFSITSRTTNGANNLPTGTSGGAKNLNVRTSNGRISIEFIAV